MNDNNLTWPDSSNDQEYTHLISKSTTSKSQVIENYEEVDIMIANEKEKELKQIEHDLEHLSETMKHTSKLVEDQSPIIDDIQYDIEESVKNTTEGTSSLGKAENGFWLATFAAAGFTTVGFVLAASTQSRHLIPQVKNMLWGSTDPDPDPDNHQNHTQNHSSVSDKSRKHAKPE